MSWRYQPASYFVSQATRSATLSQTFAPFTLTAAAQVAVQAQASDTLGLFTLSATASGANVNNVSAAVAFDPFTLVAATTVDVQAALSATFAPFRLTSAVNAAVRAASSKTLSPFTLAAQASVRTPDGPIFNSYRGRATARKLLSKPMQAANTLAPFQLFSTAEASHIASLDAALGSFLLDAHIQLDSGLGLVAIVGQSNAAGRKDVTASFAVLCHADGLDLDYPAIRIKQWEATNNDPPQLLYDTETTLHYRTDASSVALGFNFGPELSLGRMIDRSDIVQTKKTWRIVKYSIGGTTLAFNWNPDGTYPTGQTPNLFGQEIAYIQAAEAFYNAPLVAVVYVQGESDALDQTQANAFEANLTNYISRFRGTKSAWANVPFVINRISSQLATGGVPFPYKDVVRTAIQNVCVNVPHCEFTNCDDLTLDSGLHFVNDAYDTLGQRLGLAVLHQLGIQILPTAKFSFIAQSRFASFFDLSTTLNIGATISSWFWQFGDGATSTSQNPSHLYGADGAYTVTLTVTDSGGASSQITRTITVANPTWTTDSIAGVGCPATASEWTQLITVHGLTMKNGAAPLPVPSNLYNMQETSGQLVDAIGGKNMTIGNVPAYRKTKSGWSRFFIGASGAATTQSASNATMPNINAHDVFELAYLDFTSTGTFRDQFAYGAAGLNSLEVNSNKIRKRTGPNAKNGSLVHAGQVRPYGSGYANTISSDTMRSDIEELVLPYAAQSSTAHSFFFSINTDVTATTDIGYDAIWQDVWLTKDEWIHLIQALGFGPSL